MHGRGRGGRVLLLSRGTAGNTTKHAPGARVHIAVSVADGMLRFEVDDEGSGIEAGSIRQGHGLSNMADRIAALDGSFAVHDRHGGGTVVTGTLPAAGAGATR